jgi:hypothetical protein
MNTLRPHDLRHAAVALWVATGANLFEVSRRAGHTSVSFTLDRYGHPFPEADQAVANRFDALISSEPTTTLLRATSRGGPNSDGQETDTASAAFADVIAFVTPV